MDYDLCATPYKQLANAWNMYMDTGSFHTLMPRPDGYTSYIRCRHEKIFNQRLPLSELELARKHEANNRLIGCSRQVIDGIDNILAKEIHSNYTIFLLDEEGMVIESVNRGDIPVMRRYEENHACINAIDLSTYEKKVLEVYEYEHFYPDTNDWHTIGESICNYDKSIAGALGIGCQVSNVSAIVPVVKIGTQLIDSTLAYEQVARNNLSMLLEEISDAVIAINKSGVIMNVNQAAVDFLNLSRECLNGQIISSFLTGNVNYNILFSQSQGFNSLMELTIKGKNKLHKTTVKKSIIGNLNGYPLIMLMFNHKPVKNLGSVVNTANDQYYCFDDLIGESQSMRLLKSVAAKAAASAASVLIEGESGTGKELLAQSIHRSSRPDGPFVALNCGAFTKELLQSELFGYEDGAFTGAKKGGKPGKFEAADGGTLFLDEIGEMPLDMQVSLLRCLQDKTVTRVGGTEAKRVDLRIIAATNQSLYKLVQDGKFRADLYYRLNVIEMKMPPLRERSLDTPLISQAIVEQLAGENGKPPAKITEEAMNCLLQYPWPGNVRELRNVLERAYIYSDGQVINEECLPEHIRAGKTRAEANGVIKEYEKFEKTAILEVLTKNRWNITKSAEELGMARSTLYKRMDKFDIPH